MVVLAQQTYVPDDIFEAYLEANGMGNGIPNDDSLATIDTNSCFYHTFSYDTLSVTASIIWNGINLNTSGDYSDTLTNSAGCDSIAYLNLTITNTTGILDIANNKSNLVKRLDLLRRETKEKKNIPLFYIYDDGTVEKRIIIE